jgi:hypothetical protein
LNIFFDGLCRSVRKIAGASAGVRSRTVFPVDPFDPRDKSRGYNMEQSLRDFTALKYDDKPVNNWF